MFGWGNLRERDHYGDLGVNGRIILRWIIKGIISVIKSRGMRWAGHVASMGKGSGVYNVWVGKPEGKRPLRRPGRKWEDNIKMDYQRHYQCDKVERNEMGWACSEYGEGEWCVQCLGGET